MLSRAPWEALVVVETLRRHIALLLLTGGFLVGCAGGGPAPTPSATPNLSTLIIAGTGDPRAPIDLRNDASVGQRLVIASLADVWAALPAVFAQLGIETTRVDSEEGVIGNPGFRARRVEGQRISRYLDCGRSFGRDYADQYSVTLGIVVQLVPAANGGTIVRTVLDAYARDPGQSGPAVHCITRGLLERRIVELVAERVER